MNKLNKVNIYKKIFDAEMLTTERVFAASSEQKEKYNRGLTTGSNFGEVRLDSGEDGMWQAGKLMGNRGFAAAVGCDEFFIRGVIDSGAKLSVIEYCESSIKEKTIYEAFDGIRVDRQFELSELLKNKNKNVKMLEPLSVKPLTQQINEMSETSVNPFIYDMKSKSYISNDVHYVLSNYDLWRDSVFSEISEIAGKQIGIIINHGKARVDAVDIKLKSTGDSEVELTVRPKSHPSDASYADVYISRVRAELPKSENKKSKKNRPSI